MSIPVPKPNGRISVDVIKVDALQEQPRIPPQQFYRWWRETALFPKENNYLSIEQLAQGNPENSQPDIGDSHYLTIFKLYHPEDCDLGEKLRRLPSHTFHPISWLIEHLAHPDKYPEIYLVDRELYLLSPPDILQPFMKYAMDEGTNINAACGSHILEDVKDEITWIFEIESKGSLQVLYYPENSPLNTLPPVRFMLADFDTYYELPSPLNRFSVPISSMSGKLDSVGSDSMVGEYREIVKKRTEHRIFLTKSNYKNNIDRILTIPETSGRS